jgi:hypothetical protein
MHRKHQTGIHWRGRFAAIVAAPARPLLAAGTAGVLAAAMLTAGVLAGAAPAGAAPVHHKSAALARPALRHARTEPRVLSDAGYGSEY